MSIAIRFIHRHPLVARGWPADMEIQTNRSYSQGRRDPQKQGLVHSDHGSQYTNHEWQSGLEGGMSRRGNWHDNAGRSPSGSAWITRGDSYLTQTVYQLKIISRQDKMFAWYSAKHENLSGLPLPTPHRQIKKFIYPFTVFDSGQPVGCITIYTFKAHQSHSEHFLRLRHVSHDKKIKSL